MSTVGRLVALAELPRGRVAVSILLGALAVAFGVALMATAGYLIARAAEQPPILALTTTIVVVRFLALARPLARYLERLTSHDVTLRALGRIRQSVYARIEPLAPAELDAYRRGDLVSRLVADVDSLQGLYLRGLAPPLVALVVSIACVVAVAFASPAAAVVLAVGLLLGGVALPLVAARLAQYVGERQAATRGDLSSELVEILRGAPELVAFGRERDALARIGELDARLMRLSRRDALVAGVGDAASVLVAGLTTVAVLAVAVSAHDAGTLDRVLIAALTLLALSSFDAIAPLPGAARELRGTLAAGERVLDLVERSPVVRDPATPAALGVRAGVVSLEGVSARYGPDGRTVLDGVSATIRPAGASRWSGRAVPERRP